jgi:hypothetical protein
MIKSFSRGNIMKKCLKFKPGIIWREHYEIDLEYEKLIYRWLCGTIKKKNINKLKSEHMFERYIDWKNYVQLKYSSFDNLDEFYRFLKLRKRGVNKSKDLYSLLGIPIIVVLISEFMIKFYGEVNNFDISEINNYIDYTPNVFIKIIIPILASVGFSLIIVIVIIGIVLYLYGIMSDYENANDEYYFYDDYMEIIKEMLDKKIRP